MNSHKTLIPENFKEIGQKLKELEQFMYFALIWGVPTLIQKTHMFENYSLINVDAHILKDVS